MEGVSMKLDNFFVYRAWIWVRTLGFYKIRCRGIIREIIMLSNILQTQRINHFSKYMSIEFICGRNGDFRSHWDVIINTGHIIITIYGYIIIFTVTGPTLGANVAIFTSLPRNFCRYSEWEPSRNI